MTHETRTYLQLARIFALLALAVAVLSGCGGYLSPGGGALWCRTRDGRHDCDAARVERDSIARADSLRADTSRAR
jgi:hypothetical protein